MAGHSKIDFNQPLDLEKLPASLMLSTSQDPANAMPGAPPMFGQDFVPHIFTTAGYVGSAARAYPIEDEALRSSPENAERMRTECGIMECLEARQRATALLPWHLEPEDPTDPKQKQLVVELTKIMERIPRFTEYRRYLMEAIWYGRYMSVHKFCSQRIGNNWRVCIKEHEPRHGDKILFRYDDGTFNYKPGQIGIRVHATWAVDKQPKLAKLQPNRIRHKVEATQYGLAYWLDDYERRTVAVHRHMVEDGPFGDPRSLGRINGIGIRDRIYWTWYAMQECLADLLTFLARAATGVRLWRYPSGNPAWKEKVEAASKNALANGVADILFPVEPNEYAALYGVEQIEPGVGGAQMIQELIQKFFLHKIKRYILGQTLTSEAEATGLGSGVADAHLATFDDIVTYDAINFQETITTDLVTPLKDRNFPEMAGCLVRFIFDIESPNAEKVLAGLEAGWSMGLGIREDDLYQILGTRRPDADDAVLRNPSIAAAQQQIDINRQQMQQQQAEQAMGLLGGMDAAGMPSQPGGEPVPADAVGDADTAGETAEQPIEEGPQPMAGESSSPGGLKPETGPAVLADPSMPISPPAEQPAESPADPVADPVAGPAATTDEMQRANPIVSNDNPEPPPMEPRPVEESELSPGGDIPSMFADAWNRQAFLDAWKERTGYSMDDSSAEFSRTFYAAYYAQEAARLETNTDSDRYATADKDLAEVEMYRQQGQQQGRLWTEEDEQKHPRDEDGKWTTAEKREVRTTTKTGKEKVSQEWTTQSGIPEWVTEKIPPSWSDVKIASSADNRYQFIGTDEKGREQRRRSAWFAKQQDEKKWDRVRQLRSKLRDMLSENLKTRTKDPDTADCFTLIALMGLRPGSESDTGADYKSYGATTLEGRHVVQDGDEVFLDFVPGKKKGQSIRLPVVHDQLAAMLLRRKESAGEDGHLFSTTTAKLRKRTKQVGGDEFKAKDLRTTIGTETAVAKIAEMVQSGNLPTDNKSLAKAVKAVCQEVATILGNTWNVAKDSYILPDVWKPLKAKMGEIN